MTASAPSRAMTGRSFVQRVCLPFKIVSASKLAIRLTGMGFPSAPSSRMTPCGSLTNVRRASGSTPDDGASKTLMTRVIRSESTDMTAYRER